MGFYKDWDSRDNDINIQRMEQLDLLRRVSYLMFPRVKPEIIKTALFILGLVADRDTGEDLFKIMKRFY